MKLGISLSLVCASLGVIPAAADVVTAPFQTITFPNVPDPNIANAAQLGLFVIEGGNTVPTAINDAGVITGHFPQTIGIWSKIASGVPDFGFLDANGSYGAFYGLNPDTFNNVAVYPTGINDSGTIVGNYMGDAFLDNFGFAVDGVSAPSLYQPDGYVVSAINYPGLPVGFDNTFVRGINDNGQIIGTYLNQLTGDSGGFQLLNGAFTPLSYTPIAINNLGQILGRDSSGNNLIDTNGNLRNLGILPFAPTGFNDSGTIVGGDYLYHNGFLTQIQLAGESGVQINAINDEGSFVGTANGADGQIGFEVTTPEPFTGVPLIAGLCGLAFLRFRTRRAAKSPAV